MFGGAGVNALTLPYLCYNDFPESSLIQMLQSIDKIWDEDVVIRLGNHPANNHTLEKRKKQIEEGGNPFIDSNSWHEFLNELRRSVEEKSKKTKP